MPSVLLTTQMAPVALAASAPVGAAYHLTKFAMQKQCQPNWCWLAVAVSISQFYPLNSSGKWTQCSLANNQLNSPTDCCVTPATSVCNHIGYLDDALTATKNLNSATGPISLASLINELTNGRAVGCRMAWNNSQDGHFVAISGGDPNTQMLDVQDPLYGFSTVDFPTFQTNYSPVSGQGATWTDTYLTHG